MRQYMPGDTGWTDRGPSVGAPKVNDPAHVRATIRQGENRPRTLSPADAVIANENRVSADDDVAAMEKWHRDGGHTPEVNDRSSSLSAGVREARVGNLVSHIEEFCSKCQTWAPRFSAGRIDGGGFDRCRTCRGVPSGRPPANANSLAVHAKGTDFYSAGADSFGAAAW